MRSGCKGGLCAVCGIESDEGLFWRCNPKVLDFGVDTMPPIEPDMSQPMRCDNCELLCRIIEDYKSPIEAQRTWCAVSARDALRLMRWQPSEALKRSRLWPSIKQHLLAGA